ncbi:MAG: DUF6944 family repetitive protein [Bacillus sp. (in: firmicutes)]
MHNDQSNFYSESNQNHTNNQSDALNTISTWGEAFGATLAAIGSTPIVFLNSDFLFNLNLIGETIQIGGITGQVEAENKVSYNSIGNVIQIGGISWDIGNFLTFRDQNTELQFHLRKSFSVQFVGVSVCLTYYLNQPQTLFTLYNIYANVLQLIGLSIKILSTLPFLSSKKSQTFSTVGNWIQAIGIILMALSLSVK